MRTSIAALLVLFGLLFFANSAAAQSGPISSQLLQQTPQKSPTGAKLLPPLPATHIMLPKQDGSGNDHAIKLQELKTWIERLQNQKDGFAKNLQRFGDAPDAPNCAHIRIIQAPDMDSEMVVQISPADGGPITTFQGLPPCRRDLPAPIIAQRFYGVPPMPLLPPRRPFVPQPPASQIPSAQPQSVEPKVDAPNPKR